MRGTFTFLAKIIVHVTNMVSSGLFIIPVNYLTLPISKCTVMSEVTLPEN